MGTETMICFSGLRRTLYRPGSRLSSCAAWSKRSIIASNGFSSARNMSLSRPMMRCDSVLIAGSLMGTGVGVSVSGTRRLEHRVQRALDCTAVRLPADGQDRDEGLGSIRRPPLAQLHRVLFGDNNIIGLGGGLHEARNVLRRIGMVIGKGEELHLRAERANLHRKAQRIGDPRRRDHAPLAQDGERAPYAGAQPLEVVEAELHHRHR